MMDHKVFTKFKRFASEGEVPVGELDPLQENWLIKGDNLLVLHTLKQRFAGQVKLIYIDPPYNTGGDANTFLYNNSFNHSTWLGFMKDRLQAAKHLLRDDGIIAVSIDDNEQAYLKVLMDEIFGRDNCIGTIAVQSNPGGRDTNTFFATSHEYCFFYAINKDRAVIKNFELTKEDKKAFDKVDEKGKYKRSQFRRGGGYSTPEERPNSYYPIYYEEETKSFSLDKKEGYIEILPIDAKGVKRVWRRTRPSFLKLVEDGDVEVSISKNGHQIHIKDRLEDKEHKGKKPKTMWYDSKYSATTSGTMLLKKILPESNFSYPKSLYLLIDIISITTNPGDIILDFFSGSGTTGHAVLDLNKKDNGNRKFVLVEQMDYIENITCERLKKTITGEQGGDSFVYCELLPL